jgi:hypothetical protein
MGIARNLSTKATHDPAYPLDIASRPYLIGHLGAGSRFLQTSPLPLQNGALGAVVCPGDRIVWANTATHTLHLRGDHHFAHTKGGFACETEARALGYRGPVAHA